MLTTNAIVPEEINAPTAETSFAATAKSQFIAFFQSKGFACATDALQQLKATYNKMTVRFSISDAKIASDQGYAICYVSFSPLNRRYKIAIGNIQQAQAGNEYAYTLLEDTFARAGSSRQKNSTFYSLEQLLDAVFPKATSFTGAITLQSFFSFLF
ncbi:hypothetical protein FC093_05405 [Ilyomonas limi]|uniref:Uncharacterized protein n=1 Tax=Ilyomonas limi TaxID=2575867 RepID=A0A4U3L908_9BACT|nr:hypothetical protein [Ilyomonas limi]TKK70187.1 hypothetical protein FC093_05405 [Ilyomonas limi]